MSALACGLDIGTTNVKVVLMDRTGRVRWSRAVPTPRVASDGGPVTDASVLLDTLEEMLVAGWREVGGGLPLHAIAGAGVGEDGVLLAPDRSPRALSLPWFDERATGEASELARSPAASPYIGIAVDRARTAAKWLWLARNGGAAGPGDVWVALSDYPLVAWSGRPFMSQSLAARTAAYDVYARRWHAPMLAAAQAPPLPEVLAAGTAVGPVRSGRLLASGAADARTAIVAGGHDHPVAASFIRSFERHAIVDSMGTAELVYGERPLGLEPALHPLVAFAVPVLGGPGIACLGVQELAAALEPYRRSAHGDLVAELLSAPVIPGMPADAATIRRARHQDAGSLSALPREEAAHLCRAAIEATGLVAREMMAVIGGKGPIFATGGWSRSDALMELRASLFGRPILRMAEEELTGAGAALLAWRADPAFDPSRIERPASTQIKPRADWADAYRRSTLAG